ncbi:RNA 2'-phosphotransferase [Kitasatospora sp. MMS16-BH015]|uniref:RNA 2'-phosphotransferase n=1 Tax=Kitasatospora sp. MMS16-BH015 TaxID=2018025 RepID=UPI000CA2561D|nr:RNA 2'-phosphotransferase [Kitasatospora sp. MMS16-BH015]AUG80324.1 RNA 2'-phosphotransferase [Kitasatospora sp. MMS16-BH015]
MLDEKRTVKVSKRMAKVLRHDPGSVGLTLDEAGWVPVAELLAALGLARAELDHVVATNNKKRFAFSADGLRIRASQGHTLEVDLGLAAATPPPVLYHGTTGRSLASIYTEGLRPMSRQDVHLSADRETAVRVGSRHGRPVVLLVDTAAMAAAGHVFRLSENGVWLTDAVPPAYLTEG